MSTVVYVFADWEAFDEPILVGTLRSSVIRNKEHFSFSYDNDWLQSPYAQKIDPDLNLYSGAQLWRRIVFNIAVSNTDDHLRNHGFIYSNGGWLLSPAYDINPVTPANGLHLNITEDDNSLSYELAMDVIEFFQLSTSQAQRIKDEVLLSVARWKTVANSINISRSEQLNMASAFNV